MAAFFGANEIWKSYDGEGREPVVLAGVRETDVKVPVSEEEFAHSLEELAELANCYADTVPYQYRPLCGRRKGR